VKPPPGYPRLLAQRQQADVIDAAVSDENFEFGLAAVLAGLEGRVTRP
jgi:hypothetical protein